MQPSEVFFICRKSAEYSIVCADIEILIAFFLILIYNEPIRSREVLYMWKYIFHDKDIVVSHSLDDTPNQIEFKPHAHSNAEILYILSGKGTFHIEGQSYELKSGDLLITRPLEAHYLEIKSSVPYERIVVSFHPELFQPLDPDGYLLRPFMERKAGHLNQYHSADMGDASYGQWIRGMVQHCDNERLNIITQLMPLLNRIGRAFGPLARKNAENGSIESEIIRYINNHIAENLNLPKICEKYYISTAQLCRRFKKATGSTVNEYITTKRLLLARKLLSIGEKPVAVYEKCGFNNYSTFYRAYIRYFGHSPKSDKDFDVGKVDASASLS